MNSYIVAKIISGEVADQGLVIQTHVDEHQSSSLAQFPILYFTLRALYWQQLSSNLGTDYCRSVAVHGGMHNV